MKSEDRHHHFASTALVFVGAWLGGVYLMYTHNYEFSYDTLSRAIDPISSVAHGLPYLTAQVVVLYALLRPVSFHYSWGRALAAWVVCVSWTAYLVMGIMHSPGWFHSNVWWLLGVSVALTFLLLISGGAAIVKRAQSGHAGT